MGLFDTIICKTALPIPKDRGELSDTNWMTEEFQTKDLDAAMRVYEIREDGTLWEKVKSKWSKTKFIVGITISGKNICVTFANMSE